MICTWCDPDELGQWTKHCHAIATKPQKGNDGATWANLCAEHDAELERCLREAGIQGTLRGWIRAQGGPKKLAEIMTKGPL